jgi:hypothetical protein
VESFYTVDEEPVNNLFSDEEVRESLRKAERAHVVAEGGSSTAGTGGIFSGHNDRSFHALIDIAERIGTSQGILAAAGQLDERPRPRLLELERIVRRRVQIARSDRFGVRRRAFQQARPRLEIGTFGARENRDGADEEQGGNPLFHSVVF